MYEGVACPSQDSTPQKAQPPRKIVAKDPFTVLSPVHAPRAEIQGSGHLRPSPSDHPSDFNHDLHSSSVSVKIAGPVVDSSLADPGDVSAPEPRLAFATTSFGSLAAPCPFFTSTPREPHVPTHRFVPNTAAGLLDAFSAFTFKTEHDLAIERERASRAEMENVRLREEVGRLKGRIEELEAERQGVGDE